MKHFLNHLGEELEEKTVDYLKRTEMVNLGSDDAISSLLMDAPATSKQNGNMAHAEDLLERMEAAAIATQGSGAEVKQEEMPVNKDENDGGISFEQMG